MRERTIECSAHGYVNISKMYGASIFYIFKTHIARDVMPLLIITSLSVISKTIMQEASLAYLGLSDPLSKSWGLMINKCVAFKGIYFTDYWKWWLLPPVFSLVATIALIRLIAKELEAIYTK